MARLIVKQAGYDVINLKRNERFGWDWIRDVERLAPLIKSRIETVFDVGANIGQTAKELRNVFPNARIHCFEPTPSTFSQLALAVAGDLRIVVHPIALGPAKGRATLQCFDVSLLNSCAVNPPYKDRFNQTTTSIDVPMSTIDDAGSENKIDRISLLKVDAEGFDLEILKGARRMLAEGRIDFIVSEIGGLAPQGCGLGNDLYSIARELYPYGFRFVSSYTDAIAKTLPLYLISNALFVRSEPRLA